MPWECKTVSEQRAAFVKEVTSGGNFSAICRAYGITRKTGYKWVNRTGLTDHSRRPKTSPKQTVPEVEQAILEIRKENPCWGGKTIRAVMERDGHTELPCVKTFNNILKRNDCITKEASQAATPYQRFEKEHCNDMWQIDFKGDFALSGGGRCYPLDILDDHSRFCIRIDPKPNTLGVTESVRSAFLEFGMPKAILSDNGWTFRGLHGGYTQFEKWLMCHDILPIHGRVRHPQTQGKIERFHRTMEYELLKESSFSCIEDAKVAFDCWRTKYNFQRPHHALGLRSPGDLFQPSPRLYTDTVTPFDYGNEHRIIKVNKWGYLRFAHHQVFLSETMAGEHIQMQSGSSGNSFYAYFRNFKIAKFDAISGERLNRTIARGRR